MGWSLRNRLGAVGICLALAYAFALWQPVRAWYSDVDKLAHAIVFAGVYGLLIWTLPWRPLAVACMAWLLGGAVEVHQYFLPKFTASLGDLAADGAGIVLAFGVHAVWRRFLRALPASGEFSGGAPLGGLAPQAQFESAVAVLPLVSVDWVLTNPEGELLVGRRLNAPARDTWFTPGGRIRKGEAVSSALRRVAREELGASTSLTEALMLRAVPLGAWDHFYPDSAFSPTNPTHYVNLPFAAALSGAEVDSLRLPVGEQHGHWRWIALAQAADEVHAHVQPYVAWLRSCGASPSSSSSPSLTSRLDGSEPAS